MLLFRYPDWVSGDAVVRINGKPDRRKHIRKLHSACWILLRAEM